MKKLKRVFRQFFTVLIHRVFWDLPEIPVFPQGLSDLIATARYRLIGSNRLIEAGVKDVQASRGRSNRHRLQVNKLSPHSNTHLTCRLSTLTTVQTTTLRKGKKKACSERKKSLKWARYPLHNSPSKEF